MTLRSQILTSAETLSDLVWAAEQRFRESEELLCAGRFAGAVYLSGLCAEMWLKLAGFRFLGAGPATTIDSQLGPARTWMKSRYATIGPESYHSLWFWAEYLIRRRLDTGKPLSTGLVGHLRHHVVNRLFHGWKIDMRYRLLSISEVQAWRVYNDTSWVRQNWPVLGR